MSLFSLLISLVVLVLTVSCTASRTGKLASSSASSIVEGRNNVINSTSKNTRFSSSKTDGSGTLTFKGSNNIINIDITDSDIAAFNTKTVTIVQGDNNNLTSTIRKCVLRYQDRTDTLLISGNQLKIDFTADHVAQLIEGAGGTQEITAGRPLNEFVWAEWKTSDAGVATEQVFVEALCKYLTLPQAFAHYSAQAHNGDYSAFYMLGRFFDNLAADAPTDIPKAIEYYEVAARHNHAEAALRLGHIYEVGDFEFDNIPVNRPKAQYYYRLAAQNGSEPAQEKLRLWDRY